MVKLKFVTLCAALLFQTATMLAAQEVHTVYRQDFEDFLLGRVDFDQLSSAPFPGSTYYGRIPFRGVVADTYFAGQIPILRKQDKITVGSNAGMPSNPLREGSIRDLKSELSVVSSTRLAGQNFLVSRAYEPTVAKRDQAVGFGSLVFKFSNGQFVFGFDLKALDEGRSAQPIVAVKFYSVEGVAVGEPVVINSFGVHTFATSDRERNIKGFELLNMGPVPIGVDDVVFEVPKLLG